VELCTSRRLRGSRRGGGGSLVHMPAYSCYTPRGRGEIFFF
jgi:hypothetical protein